MDKRPTYWTLDENDFFEKYLFYQMDHTEKANLEAKLDSDAELNANFLEFKRMYRAIEEEGIRKKMEIFHQRFENAPDTVPLRKKSLTFPFHIAATIVLLVALGGIWYFYPGNSNERLFNRYFTPDPGLPTVMGNEENYSFYEAMVDYKTGNYPKAIEKWEVLHDQNPKNDTLSYFLAMAHLAKGDAPKTIPLLEENLRALRPAFLEETHYYLGMAYLKQGDLEAAVPHLKKSGSPKAQDVLKSLE